MYCPVLATLKRTSTLVAYRHSATIFCSLLMKQVRHLRWVPEHCVWPRVNEADLPPPTRITVETASLLERLSLVDFQNQEAVILVEDAIRAADELQLVNTDNVSPLVSLLENESLFLREDEVCEGGLELRDHLLSNSSNVVEDYWTAPPGNLPISSVSRIKEQFVLKSDSTTNS